MSWVLAGLALLVAAFAVLQARRARAEARRAALPQPPPARAADAAAERLERLEAERGDARAEVRSLAGAVSRLEEALQAARREAKVLRGEIDAVRVASTERADPEPAEVARTEVEDEPPAPEEQVRTHLAAEGWAEIVLLPDPAGESAWRVEAHRDGVLQKGRARLFPDGRIEARLSPPTRAFP